MDNSIEPIVREKLVRYNLTPFDQLPHKNQERLINVEKYIQMNKNLSENFINEVKKLKLTKTAISNTNELRISRKTIYNDQVLNQYIDFAVEEQEDYLNLNTVAKLDQKLKEIEERYNKMLDNIIEINILKSTLKQYTQTINELIEKNNNLQLIT